MKITVITGSPRKGGNSALLADAFIEEALAKGADVTRFDAAFLNIAGCRACGACAKKGECIVEDDFVPIADEIENADAIVVASPVYWYNFPSQLKAAIDRAYSLYNSGKTLEGTKCALLACCQEAGEVTFTAVRFAFEKSVEAMNADLAGMVLVTGVGAKGDVKKTDGLERAKKLADQIVEAPPRRDPKDCQYQMYQGKRD